MTWHLKDRELEEKLIAIDPKFLERINEGAVLKDNLRMDTCMMITDHVAVRFEAKDFEEVPEYNPHAWNEFPKVKPPYDVMMRIEFENGEGTKGFYKHCFDGSDCWFSKSRIAFPKTMLINNPITRFRPWSED